MKEFVIDNILFLILLHFILDVFSRKLVIILVHFSYFIQMFCLIWSPATHHIPSQNSLSNTGIFLKQKVLHNIFWWAQESNLIDTVGMSLIFIFVRVVE